MAATYGYGGEFSSDEDVDKMEQQTERLAQSKFDAFSQQRPSKRQIEEAIETIKKLPHDQDVLLTDELLAGLLDHYKTQRGPIVDSTRNLYKKIILRLVRGDKHQTASNGNDLDVQKETNGNNVFNNNNNPNLVNKEIEIVSSDEEEEPKAPTSHLAPDYTRQAWKSNPTPMEVDLEDTNNIAPNKGNNISSSDGTTSESSSEDDDDQDDNEVDGDAVQHVPGSNDQVRKDQVEDTSDSEVLDVTPQKESGIKQTRPVSWRKVSTDTRKKALKFDEKESAVKEQQKRHFTRSSQRVATRATAAAKAKQADVSSGKVDEVASANLASNQKSNLSMNRKPLLSKKVIISALLVVAVAFALFYFKNELTRSTDHLLKRAIKF